jgi:hypothetical protein
MGCVVHRDIEIRGTVYPDVRSAAEAVGVGCNAILKAMAEGRLSKVGLRQTQRPEMPIQIRGKVYKNAKTAARAMGVTPGAVYSSLYRGDLHRLGLPRRGGAKSKPFRLGGYEWPSMRAASMDLGFHPEYVSRSFLKNRETAKARILGAAMKFAAKNAEIGVGQ